jgi:hypothetical protein
MGDIAKTDHSRDQICHFALRLTNPEAASYGSATYADKQVVSYGFTTEFTFQMLHPSKECKGSVYGPNQDDYYFCQQHYGSGFSFLI